MENVLDFKKLVLKNYFTACLINLNNIKLIASSVPQALIVIVLIIEFF